MVMLNEMSIAGMGSNQPKTLAARRPLTFLLHAGWILGKLTLAGLLLTYMAGWVQDLQRLTQLEAQPTPPSRVISKREAWQRVHKRSLQEASSPPSQHLNSEPAGRRPGVSRTGAIVLEALALHGDIRRSP
jgi:hypothetical protein